MIKAATLALSLFSAGPVDEISVMLFACYDGSGAYVGTFSQRQGGLNCIMI